MPYLPSRRWCRWGWEIEGEWEGFGFVVRRSWELRLTAAANIFVGYSLVCLFNSRCFCIIVYMHLLL
jgi:hypothetical protein